ncbi:MAG TPA: TetR/AcrR family transcriptional regulator [Acetobacteraceae bacterium]|nr:TetR/AcrR family transcriptional regulator [Acetobacteraceae bacterium]
MVNAAAAADQSSLSHNLLGQRLGRKGRDTRERILAATARLLAEPADTAISLSAVAREASLGMTTLYLYFSDLTELLLAALEPIIASAEESYIAHLRARWPDENLGAQCVAFVQAYHAFWQRHARILHLRNSLADANDPRMRKHRIDMSQPLILMLVSQMDGDITKRRTPISNMATVLITGIERLVTVATDAHFAVMPIEDPAIHVGNLLRAEGRLLELAVRDCRDSQRRVR